MLLCNCIFVLSISVEVFFWYLIIVRWSEDMNLREEQKEIAKRSLVYFQPSCLLFNWECNFSPKIVDRMNELLLARQMWAVLRFILEKRIIFRRAFHSQCFHCGCMMLFPRGRQGNYKIFKTRIPARKLFPSKLDAAAKVIMLLSLYLVQGSSYHTILIVFILIARCYFP